MSTATVQINPGSDVEVVTLQERVSSILVYAKGFSVTSQADVKAATNDLSAMLSLKKEIEEKRIGYVKPLNDHVASINTSFKTISEPLSEAYELLKRKVLTWQTEQDRLRQEGQDLERLQAEVDARAAILKGDIPTGELVPIVDTPPEVPKTTRSDIGTASRTSNRKWELVDLKQVPVEYLMLDAARVGKVVRAGIPSIPGIRIWDEPGLQVRRR